MFELSITSVRFILAVTVESTMIVFTKSPTSAVSPPVECMVTPNFFNSSINSSVPFIIADNTSPGILLLFLPMVDDSIILSVAPTQSKSSIFMINASWAIPFQTDKSPVSFQYI